MKQLVILDKDNFKVHYYKVADNVEITIGFIESLGYKPYRCSWLCNKEIDTFKHGGVIES